MRRERVFNTSIRDKPDKCSQNENTLRDPRIDESQIPLYFMAGTNSIDASLVQPFVN